MRSFRKLKIVQTTQTAYFLKQNKSTIAVITALMMIFGFLCGRAILSLGMFLFCLNALWDVSPKNWIKNTYWLWGLAWTGMYLISGLWSEDIPYWIERVQVKMPFLLLPLAFGALQPASEKHLRLFSRILLLLLLGGCVWSLSFLFADYHSVIKSYSYSKVLPTPPSDHIRFSIFVAWSVIWFVLMYRRLDSRVDKILMIIGTLFCTAYLHILAVKSGLLILYSSALLYFIYLLLKKRFAFATIILFSFCSVFYFSLKQVPSFKAKFYYVMFSIDQLRKGKLRSDVSDLGRLLSYDLGWKIFREHPIAGVGAGDVRMEMKKKYELYAPETPPEERIVPHNQFLEVGLVGGIITLIPFSIWVFWPLRRIRQSRNGFYGLLTWFGLFAAIQVESMLEGQYGVFVYLFCLLWMTKHTDADATPEASAA